MARRGERIGDAYVRIHADGSRIPRDVLKEMDSLDKPMERKGEELGSGFQKGVAKGVRENKKTTNREILNSLEVSQGESEKRGRLIAGRLMTGIKSQLTLTEGRDISARMTDILVRGIQDGTIKNKKALADLLADEQQFSRLRARAIRDLTKAEGEAHAEALKLNKVFDDQRRLLEKLGPAAGDTDRHMIRFRDNTRRFADGFGAAFGRGSRNDFVNFTGSFVRNVLLAGAAVTRFSILSVRGFLQVASAGRTAFTEGGGIVGSLRAMGTEFAALAPRLTALLTSPQGLAALAAGLAAITVVLSGVISLFISLGGAVTALALAVGGALVSALTILAALLLPITFGIGGLVGAILLMDDATKKATKEAIQPFVEQMKALAKITATETFAGLQKDAKLLGEAFKDPVFESFARDLGRGLRGVREELVRAFTSTAFKDFIEEIGPKIRDQLIALTRIAVGFGAGLGGVFLAVQPSLNEFLLRLEKVGREFNEFANSDAGRAKLTEFFNKAETALASIGNLTVSVGRAFAVMFNLGGGQAGIDLIDSIRGKIEQFVAFMRANPEVVGQFFGDAVAVTRAVGNALLGIISIFDALDTHASRQGVIVFFSTLADILNFFGEVIGFVTQQVDFLGQKFSLFGTVGGALTNMIPGVNQLKTAFETAGFALGDTQTKVDTLNATPIAPTFNPTFVREAQVGYGTVLQLGTEVNNSTLFPKVQLQQVDQLDLRLQQIAAEAATEKVINVRAPQDPVLALIEKVNFLSLSVGALKDKGGAALKITAPGLDKALSQVRSLSTAISGLRPKSIAVTAPAVNGLIARLAFLNAITFKAKPLNITTNASSVLGQLGQIQNFTISDKEFTVTQRNRITGPTLRTDARGAVEFDTHRYMAAGGFANFKQLYDPFTFIGESGREAIVPLDRPLGQVDPAVRELAAFAQGKFDYLLANAVGKQGINASGWTIVTPTEDTAAVADEVVNRLVALSY